MFARVLELRLFIRELEIEKFEELIPTVSQYAKIKDLCQIFEHLDSVTKALQRDKVTVADARALFDITLSEYPDMKNRLGKNAKIV